MAIIFSDNFNSGPDAGWVMGTAWTVAGGCTPGGQLIACCDGTPYHPISVGSTISVRVQTAVLYGTSVDGSSLIWVYLPGIDSGCNFTYQLAVEPDGKLVFGMSTVASWIRSPTGGLFPTDGTMFGLQLRIQTTGPFSCNLAVDVNNVTVWSTAYNWASFASPLCPSGMQSSFSRVVLFPRTTPIDGVTYQAVFDNLEVDDSNAKVDWPACPSPVPAYCGMPTVGTPPDPPTTGTLTVTKASSPDSGAHSFGFTTTGGLTPSTFNLVIGGSQSFTSVAPGIYSVTENSDPDWLPAYSVSSGGTDNLNITIVAGGSVTLTVTNTPKGDLSGIYTISPPTATGPGSIPKDKYYDRPSGSSGSSIDKKIPNPTIRTALIGE